MPQQGGMMQPQNGMMGGQAPPQQNGGMMGGQAPPQQNGGMNPMNPAGGPAMGGKRPNAFGDQGDAKRPKTDPPPAPEVPAVRELTQEELMMQAMGLPVNF